MLNKIKTWLHISGNEKAVVAAVVSAVSSYMAQNGLTYKDILTKHGLWALVIGVVVHQVTYWATNTQKFE